jgi:uncharacterized protein YukE
MTAPADELNGVLDRATDQVGDIAGRVDDSITDAATTVAGTVAPVDPATGALIATAGPVVGGIVQGQVDAANGFVRGGADTVAGVVNAGTDVASGYAHAGGDLVNTAGNVVNDQVGAYRHAGSDLLDGFEHGDPVTGVVTAGGDLVVGGAKQVGDILTGVAHAATDVGTGMLHGAEDVLGGVAKGVEGVVDGTVKEFGDVTHGLIEGAAHGLKTLFGGGESKQEILKKFGHEPDGKLTASRNAAKNGRAHLEHLSSAIYGGNGASIGTADDILKPGESGLAYFDYFLPAYNAWTGQNLTTAALKTTYEAEFGMSFTDYTGDSSLLTEVASALNTSEQALQNAYNALVPSWQGAAAANFEAKLKIFFSGATATQQATSGTAREITALVGGLQKLILAKAEIVNGLYADTLTPGIDGAMAKTMVKVANDDAPDDLKRVVLGIFQLACHGRHCWDSDSYYSSDCLDDPSRQAAINAAADWCNNTLVPQTDVRLQGLTDACTETKDRIVSAFAKLVSDIKAVKDPFAGMETAHVKSKPDKSKPGKSKPGRSRPGQHDNNGHDDGTHPGTYPGMHPGRHSGTTPQQNGTDPQHNAANPGKDPGSTRPTGLPPGAHWIPHGVPLPKGWHRARNGEVLPKGRHVDPKTGLPVQTTGGGEHGDHNRSGKVNQKRDVHHHQDGSVSIGRDGGVKITPEGKHGYFTVTETDPDGTVHTYRVHFDQSGDPVVREVSVTDPGVDSPTGRFGDPFVNHGRDHGLDHPDGAVPVVPNGTGGSGDTGGTGRSGSTGVTGQTGDNGSHLNLGHQGDHGHHNHHGGMHTQLQEGAHVGADNAMGASSGSAGTASPVAGSAAAAEGGGNGGGFGGFPLGMGRGAGAGGGEQEAARRYAQRGDVVGEDDLDEWQHMGPVVGEQ